jgi:hypothetical protein
VAGLCCHHHHYMKLPALDLLMTRLYSNVTRTLITQLRLQMLRVVSSLLCVTFIWGVTLYRVSSLNFIRLEGEDVLRLILNPLKSKIKLNYI